MKNKLIAPIVLMAWLCSFTHAAPLGSAFTYQGKLNDGRLAATGSYDFRFVLYDAAVDGSQVGNILMAENLVVTNGLFTANVDFGAVFDGSSRWIEIAVRPGASIGDFAMLNPRQPLTATPYALYALTPAGPQGTPGVVGATGPAGSPGAKGDPGLTGPVGATGPQGPIGLTGATGNPGPAGPVGSIGATGATGDSGPVGPQGPLGASGATGPTGPKGLNWRGAWNAATSYGIDDAVAHNGSSWMAKVAHNGSAPVEPSANWDLLAKNGNIGATGPQGPQGLTGATGSQGPQGTAGPQGPSGAFTLAGATASFVGGSVGIGTTTPEAKLHVEGGDILVGAPGEEWIFHTRSTFGGDFLHITDLDGGVPQWQRGLTIQENGNVTIGGYGYFATGGEENLRIVRGIVAADGTHLSRFGCCFSVNRISVGTYDISFVTPFSDTPALTVTAGTGSSFVTAHLGPRTFNTFRVYLKSDSNVAIDQDFNFIAIGPR